ncbi:MFS transporter [Staphylococcus succinus]|uniref:YbfB/YjiJ family MFS transporter n=1 Tax=Staphylococcus succinus TaxID=61015 RepID=UPI000D1FC994|nr:YbfB/YjiJ family MFS transporter [Staphylococcus succinus]PTI44277.1 MFS transporter [Staphylococcus succinus]
MQHAYKQLILGMVCLFIVMAIGRFAYTPIMPFMQHIEGMNDQNAGILATINYLGYLIGAIIPIWIIIFNKVTDLKIYLLINIITTLLMGISENFTLWIMFRLISGITSGTVFVLASNITLEALRLANKERMSGMLYSAVGLGIFASSIFIFTTSQSWSMTWVILGLCSLVIGSFVVKGMRPNPTFDNRKSVAHEKVSASRVKLNKRFMFWFSVSYFCEGAGYIITGTFLVAIVKSIPALSEYAALSWMFVGLGAIPSTILWSVLADKIGRGKAIYLAFILQIIGVVLPVFSESIVSLIISSLLFGGTFLGLTTLFMSEGQNLMFKSESKINLVATLTVIYSLGQMIAPTVSGVLIGNSGNYNAALIFASVILILGLLASMYSYKTVQV